MLSRCQWPWLSALPSLEPLCCRSPSWAGSQAPGHTRAPGAQPGRLRGTVAQRDVSRGVISEAMRTRHRRGSSWAPRWLDSVCTSGRVAPPLDVTAPATGQLWGLAGADPGEGTDTEESDEGTLAAVSRQGQGKGKLGKLKCFSRPNSHNLLLRNRYQLPLQVLPASGTLRSPLPANHR